MILELQMSASLLLMEIRLSFKQSKITSKVFYLKAEEVWKELYHLLPRLNKVEFKRKNKM